MRYLILICLIAGGLRLQAQTKGESTDRLVFPFSEYVIRSDWAMPIVWKYRPYEDIRENESVIAPPAFGQDWNAWYKRMKEYQVYLRAHLNDTSALYLDVKLSRGKTVRLHYKRVLNDMKLRPGDEVIFDGSAKIDHGTARVRYALIYIPIGQQMSHAIAKTETIDTISVSLKWTSLHEKIRLPVFDTMKLLVQPVVYLESDDVNACQMQVKNLHFSIPSTPLNKRRYDELKASFYPKSAAVDPQLYARKEMQWLKSNFTSGFAFLWDQDLWDANKKVFTVQRYCDKMKSAFGGCQSVLFWYSYPNLGIDQRNTWEFLKDIPGGIDGLKSIVETFHKNGVKVYFPYTSWEIDTHRNGGGPDAWRWSEMISKTNADGLFFDVFFDAGDFQKYLDKAKRGISIGTEHHPSLQNIQGYNGLTSSWGQTIEPYQNNGISRGKWMIPAFMQWKINRNETDRQNSMAYSWVNGQGILVWENVFGYMNTWNAQDRKDLRKINAIYQHFYNLYTSDSWKPYLPNDNPHVHISSWENSNYRVWNIVTDSGSRVSSFKISPLDKGAVYYDLWHGKKVSIKNDELNIPINRFGCVLEMKRQLSPSIASLLIKQRKEDRSLTSSPDQHVVALSAKLPRPAPDVPQRATKMQTKLLPITGGSYDLVAKHLKREGGCFPDEDAKDNNDYRTEKNAFGKTMIVHHDHLNTGNLQIMQRVVTNGEYEHFILSSHYKPQDTMNYLTHWKGKVCPDSMLNQPVVYVSLDDARAYARWAGMRLPTEWEWQVAGELNGESFVFNEVWEWNESERFDGHNHFVSLRGGCATWKLKTSDWYFPGTPDNTKPGGTQPLNSHCKYYLMLAGFDRAATIGFRCVR